MKRGYVAKTSKRDRKLSNLIIYPEFQLLMLFIQGAFMSFGFGTIGFQLNRSFSQFEGLGKEIHLQSDHPFFRLIHLQANQLYFSLAVAFLISITFSSLITLIVSHRLAGPIVRTRMYFQTFLKDGRLEGKLTFRKGDFFSDLPSLINESIRLIGNPNEKKDCENDLENSDKSNVP